MDMINELTWFHHRHRRSAIRPCYTIHILHITQSNRCTIRPGNQPAICRRFQLADWSSCIINWSCSSEPHSNTDRSCRKSARSRNSSPYLRSGRRNRIDESRQVRINLWLFLTTQTDEVYTLSATLSMTVLNDVNDLQLFGDWETEPFPAVLRDDDNGDQTVHLSNSVGDQATYIFQG